LTVPETIECKNGKWQTANGKWQMTKSSRDHVRMANGR
jgi:hypothetical protein